MSTALAFWRDNPSLGAFVICLLSILVPAALLLTKMILKYRVRKLDHEIRLAHVEARREDAKTYRELALREQDRLDRALDQSSLPFDEIVKWSARRGAPDSRTKSKPLALPSNAEDDEEDTPKS